VRYISLFSGIEAATVAWHNLGWSPVAFADIDEFPSEVLRQHYPQVPNLGDVTEVDWNDYKGKAQLVVGGSPCQSFSIAGKRLGLDDPRGNLALHYLKVVSTVRPKFFVYENVVGLLSSDEGRDFAAFLREVENIGYGFAYRVLDSQFFGVPQRRRRLFVVGCADGDWRSAAAILFESGSIGRATKKGKKKGENFATFAQESVRGTSETKEDGRGIKYCSKVAPTLTHSGPPYSRTGMASVETDAMVVMDMDMKAIPIHDKATRYKGGGDTRNDDGAGNGFGVADEDSPMYTLDTSCNHAVFQQSGVDLYNQEMTGEKHCPLRTAQGHGAPAVMVNYAVRRLTPVECERLQGFPDNYTQIEWKGKAKEDCPDSPRYKALGNSMPVPVMKWIGERIDLLNKIDLAKRGKSRISSQTKLW
jgi:DNA (cytosine-5)-methyltransferase 1